jgi:hypothetical protein
MCGYKIPTRPKTFSLDNTNPQSSMSDNARVLSYAGEGLILLAIPSGILCTYYQFAAPTHLILLIANIGMVLMGCGEAINDQNTPIWRSLGLIWAIIWSFGAIVMAWVIAHPL